MSVRGRRDLHALARQLGIEVRWRDQDGVTHTCSDETLLATLRMLGVALQRPEDARAERQRLDHERAARLLEPVTVAWDGEPPVLTVRLPNPEHEDPFEIVVEHGAHAERILRDHLGMTRHEGGYGLTQKVRGTTDWSEYEVPFSLRKGQQADLLKLGLTFDGPGTVWIKDVQVLQTPVRS